MKVAVESGLFHSNEFKKQIVRRHFLLLYREQQYLNVCEFCFILNRRLKSYRPLKDNLIVSVPTEASQAHSCSGASLFWNLLNRRGTVDNCPLLQDRPVWTTPCATKLQAMLKFCLSGVSFIPSLSLLFFFTYFLMIYEYLIKHRNMEIWFFYTFLSQVVLLKHFLWFKKKLILRGFAIKLCCFKVAVDYLFWTSIAFGKLFTARLFDWNNTENWTWERK